MERGICRARRQPDPLICPWWQQPWRTTSKWGVVRLAQPIAVSVHLFESQRRSGSTTASRQHPPLNQSLGEAREQAENNKSSFREVIDADELA
jgi:hypothetical protein